MEASSEIGDQLRRILADGLQLGDRVRGFDSSTRLLGDIPEFDSIAVVTVLTMIEDEFGVVVEDDEVSADVFATFGSLADFVAGKLRR